ncbi:hypothetical protein JF541_19080 [Marinobacter hydrocarbonoclasticus]|uniref:hypothetical protein n=1 Tax=Marinobacter nauticus TaxID=2743 RepID=UPI001A901E37|nr:hypothetical protein [Marinobacter nauticus]MBN8241264.1 hypothetical protein [Marinobacter nauticus]
MRCVVFLAFVLFSLNGTAFDRFNEEAQRVTGEIKCSNPKITPGTGSWGALYGCVGGQSQTVKFFINEEAGTGQVKNVKFLWNDWTKDGSFGTHADNALAKAWVSVLGTMYAPRKVDQVINAFFGNSDTTVDGESHLFKYTHRSGPGIDERMIVVVEK